MEIKEEERNINEWWVGGKNKLINGKKERMIEERKEGEWMMEIRKKRTDEWTKLIHEGRMKIKEK